MNEDIKKIMSLSSEIDVDTLNFSRACIIYLCKACKINNVSLEELKSLIDYYYDKEKCKKNE